MLSCLFFPYFRLAETPYSEMSQSHPITRVSWDLLSLQLIRSHDSSQSVVRRCEKGGGTNGTIQTCKSRCFCIARKTVWRSMRAEKLWTAARKSCDALGMTLVCQKKADTTSSNSGWCSSFQGLKGCSLSAKASRILHKLLEPKKQWHQIKTWGNRWQQPLDGCHAWGLQSRQLHEFQKFGFAKSPQTGTNTSCTTAWVKLPNTIIEQGSLPLASATSRHTAVSFPAVVVAVALLRTCCAEAQGRSGQYPTRAGEILSEDDRSKMFAALRDIACFSSELYTILWELWQIIVAICCNCGGKNLLAGFELKFGIMCLLEVEN